MGECKMIDWSNAPDGADRYVEVHSLRSSKEYKGFSYKNKLGKYELIDAGTWIDKVDVEVMRPTEQPYMPQAGEECEVDYGDGWIKCLYLGIDVYGNHAYQISKGVYKGEFNACSSIENFRPLKTEREKFIIEGIDDLNELNPFESQGGLLGMLFDKGYRKND
jgi:hypothetical protein